LEKGSDATFLREMIGFAAQRLMELETDGLCGAAHGERSAERVNQRNGYRERDWQIRAGTVGLRGGWDLVRMKPRPKERQPQWLLFKRRDEEARPGEGAQLVEAATTSVTSGRTMGQIAAGKPAVAKPRAAAKRAPAARKLARPEQATAAEPLTGFIPPMLCTLVARARGPGLDP
jgi:ATP-dependent DNA ligase